MAKQEILHLMQRLAVLTLRFSDLGNLEFVICLVMMDYARICKVLWPRSLVISITPMLAS